MNDIAIRPLTWTPNGGPAFDIQRADLGIHLEIVFGLDENEEVRGDDVTIPALAGTLAGNRIGHRRSIELAGIVQAALNVDNEADRMASYDTMVASLRDAFRPTILGVLGVTRANGDVYSITARPLPTIVYGPEEIPGLRVVSVALESAGTPYWTVTPAAIYST